jgi:hypothetical protein
MEVKIGRKEKGHWFLVNHLRDPSGTVASSQAIEAPVNIPFVPTVRFQNSGGGTDISSHTTASMTSYYLEVTTKTLLTGDL